MEEHSNPATRVHRTRRLQFGMVDPAVVRDPAVPAATLNVYTYLTTYCDNERTAFPARATVARQLGLSVRTVDAALKAGVKLGLWTITRQSIAGRQTSNLYELHDFGGGYEPSGDGGRGAKSAPSPRADFDTPGGAKSAPELDQVNQTSSTQTSSTPPREAIADAHPQAAERSTEIRLRFPKDFDSLDRGPATQCVVKAVAAAMKAAGRPLGRGVGNRIADEMPADVRPQDLVGRLPDRLAQALTGDIKLGWLFQDHGGRKRVQVSGDPVFLYERYGAIPGADAVIDAMDGQGYSPHAIANTIAKTARDMGCEDEIPDGHFNGDDIDPAMYPDYGRLVVHASTRPLKSRSRSRQTAPHFPPPIEEICEQHSCQAGILPDGLPRCPGCRRSLARLKTVLA
jgi:hypothetical protein